MRTKWQPPNQPYQRRPWTPPNRREPAIIDVTPANVQVQPLTPSKPSLDVPIMTHSRINLGEFVRNRVAPPPPASVPGVESMHWHFDEPRDESDHELRLYLVLSQEERALIRRWGLQHHAFEQEILFDDETLDRLQLAQQAELASVSDPRLRASLAIEHKQQLAMAREAKIDITIEDYLSYPYVKRFDNRYQATNGQKKLQAIINNMRKMLEEYSVR